MNAEVRRARCRIGFVGLGSMGSPVARRLLAAGYPLTVHDLLPEAMAPLIGAGASAADCARDAARDAEVVLLSLPSQQEVRQVALGPDGVLAGLRPGTFLIDLTTVSVRFVDELEQAARAHRIRYLAAPVSQGVDNAALGRLSIFVGGSPADLAACRPVLDQIASTVIHTGAPSTAVAAKLLTNLLWFTHAAVLGEALVLGAKSGIELRTLQQVILHSCGTSWVAEHDLPSVYSGSFDPSFTTALCVKDLGLITELADLHQVPLEVTAAAHQAFRRAAEIYGPQSPELSVVRHLQETHAVSLQPETWPSESEVEPPRPPPRPT